MDYARNCGLFNAKDLRHINYCWLYLHVTTVSELFNAAGTHILDYMFQCQRPLWIDPSLIVTLQQRPSPHQIRYCWQRLCREWCTSTGALGEVYSFGSWRTSGDSLRLRRSSYLEPCPFPILYHWSDGFY